MISTQLPSYSSNSIRSGSLGINKNSFRKIKRQTISESKMKQWSLIVLLVLSVASKPVLSVPLPANDVWVGPGAPDPGTGRFMPRPLNTRVNPGDYDPCMHENKIILFK